MTTMPRRNAGPSFGPKLKFTSTRKLAYTVSDDSKAFDIRFDTAIAAGVGTPSFEGLRPSRAPIGTRLYSAVIPATGTNAKISINFNGFLVAQPGTQVTLVVVANDQHHVVHFADSGDDEGFTTSLPLRADTLSEIRLTVILVAQRDGVVAKVVASKGESLAVDEVILEFE